MNKIIIFVCAVSCLGALLPKGALAVYEIEFYVTNQTNSEKCFECTGPFSRHTPRVLVPAGGGTSYFYTAAVGQFSPYGTWYCSVIFTDSCFDEGPVPEDEIVTQGIAIPPGTASVSLQISEGRFGDTLISVIFPGLGTVADVADASVTSFLGDDPRPGRGDNDTFSFEAEGGEEVTIKLEPDPSAGHVGEGATLRLRPAQGGGSPLLVRSEKLPFEATVTIAEAGTYQIVIQSDVPDNMLSYRGGYILRLNSATDGINTLHPSDNVEN